jgi:hypothetical protein
MISAASQAKQLYPAHFLIKSRDMPSQRFV